MMTETTTLPRASKPRGIAQQFLEPFNLLRSEVDRMFDEFPARWPALHPARFMGGMLPPAVEMTETPQSYKISIEVPGIDPEEIVLQVEGDRLVIHIQGAGDLARFEVIDLVTGNRLGGVRVGTEAAR